ncbi:ABC-F family ATP-binding cassette domain-containing protein [Streptomyces silvensis]|uniref:ABC transporter ATP-binding protein n=1 Tax=Streptomyces silvensis TaxID=1765722 RepID=A0A0W7WRB0_9ACTN|nr:ABC-F family ATP-binding cassette domain-containing protein [Streptomyces silvensis]KUF13135.1 ABC transporter ATP-binding protein [Streptomyces silvensis]
MPTQISVRGVTKARGDRLLLDGVSLTVRPGERIGIVGENGAGKSTLLNLLAGRARPDQGEVTTVAEGGAGFLAQTPHLPSDHCVGDAIDHALSELRAMERRLRDLESALDGASDTTLSEYGDLLTAYELRGGYEADARVDKAMHGLGLAHVNRARRLGSLSGGEQARLGLACLIAAAPEVMFLDEPTNHLDEGALDWLEAALLAHRGTVVAVSHDRIFLERVATAILEVDEARRAVVRYGDGYQGLLAERAAASKRWEQAYAQWCEETRRLEEFTLTTAHAVAGGRGMKDNNKMAYDRAGGRVQASVAGRVRNAQERLRRLHDDPVPKPPEPLRFTARPLVGAAGTARAAGAADTAGTAGTAGTAEDEGGGRGGGAVEGDLVTLRDVRVGDRLHVPDLTVASGHRLLIHGGNGAGKSTLLRIMAGVLEPDEGTVVRRGRIGYLAQEIPVRRPTERVLATFGKGLPLTEDEQAELLLSYGLFHPRDLHVPVGSLSAGQRRRLALARLLARPADLLLLDEPANHLALTLVEELEKALERWTGALVVVSHDRLLRRRFTGRIRRMESGRLPT